MASDPLVSESVFSVKGCKWLPSKCNIFIWRAALERIPTKQALVRRNIPVDSEDCVFCEEVSESVDRLFTAYSSFLWVWNRLCEWVKIPPIYAFSFKDLLDYHNSFGGNSKTKEIVRGLVVVSCWCLWKARNSKIFSNGRGDCAEIFGKVKSLSFFWLKNRSCHRDLVWREWCKFPLYMM
ncbi:uncharacterized protein LOC110939538 [Helianthus annuus]|uniref:uncharacterized protein LOC110939538 n=1 Tax=Helianthus annuus TaxID=4232 RepID=UPI000B8F9147|nr:uncharacterized protein LOC110939538 [Helianthus annuus]